MRHPAERLRNILEAIERIERHVTEPEDASIDELVQVWFVHHVQIIREAARAIPEEIRALGPAIPWRSIVGMRHILVHEYFGIDAAALLHVVKVDPPRLKRHVQDLLDRLEP